MDQYEVRISRTPEEEWDKLLFEGDTESLALFHTTFWAARLMELLGYQPVYFSVGKNREIMLRLVAFSCSLFKIKGARNIAKYLVRSLPSRKLGILLWYGQPVFFKEADKTAYSLLAEAVDQYAGKERLKLVEGEWPLSMGSALPGNWRTKKGASLKVDLTMELEIIFSRFKPAARKAVRKAERDGIAVRRIESVDELENYYHFATECAKRYGKRMIGFRDFETMWRYFRPRCVYETFIAEHKGEMIAGLSVWGYGKTIGELGSFQSERSFQEKLYGPDLIKWHVLQWAHDLKLHSFDLAGIDPDPLEEKAKNIRRFKEKWGGAHYEFLKISV
jgi:hypothetical protein